jgi:nucleotide-binding universal stress UspA family protein
MVEPIQVVVAYDLSAGAEDALARAIDVAARAPQHVLHVIAVLDPDAGLAQAAIPKGDYAAAGELQELLASHVSARFAGVETASEIQFFVHVRIGKPAVEILGLAADTGADLIFIGAGEPSPLTRRLVGTVTEQVVRRARCPVMVARQKTYAHVDLAHVKPREHPRDWPIT